MKTAITIGLRSGQWKAIISEGDGTPEGDQKTVLPLQGASTTTEAELIGQLPAKYRQQIADDKASLVIVAK